MTAPRRPGRPKADPVRDLRADLLRTSRELLEEGGPHALSLREVARRAGCTHQAPYHYFEDRESILAALVAEGFEDFGRRLADANDHFPAEGARSTLLASGAAYVAFALEQPGVFRIMFRPDLCNPVRFPAVRESGERAFGELMRLNRLVYGVEATPASATILWAHVHGLACLLVDGPLAVHLGAEQDRAAHLRVVAERFADLALAR